MIKIIINVAGEAPGVPGEAREFVYSKIDPAAPLVTLSLEDDTGITAWYWEIIDQPTGAGAVLATPMASTTTFTPTVGKAGTYLVRCVVNGGADSATNAVAWDTEFLELRIPAAKETTQYGDDKGWAAALEKTILSLDDVGGGSGVEPGVGLTQDGKTLNIGDGSTGDIDGIAYSEDGLGVAVDGATLELNLSGQVQVKDGGIGPTQMDLTAEYDFASGIVSVAAPTENSHAASKDYVDQKVQGLEWQDSVLEQGVNNPPGSPGDGDRYIVGALPTGAWVGHENDIAEYQDPAWQFTTATEGLATWVLDEDTAYVFNGTSWVKFASIANHNDLSNLQGGAASEYYHLTSAEKTDVADKLGDLSCKVSVAPAADLTKSSGSPWTEDQVDDASSAVGNLLYIAADGHWERADCNALATAMGFGIAMAAGSGSKKIMLSGGFFRNDAWAWTPGLVLYASVTPGVMSQSAPGVGDVTAVVGIAKSATVIYLCPSLSIVENV